jgi:hypothetical protein
MKTLKLALIALFVATAMVNQAAADEFRGKPKKAVNITFDRAVKNPGLVAAILDQVDPKFMNTIEQLYVIEVIYNGALYRILGSRQSWLKLFRPDPIPVGIKKRSLAPAVE